MAINLQADSDLSHAVINYLSALYRGKLAALNVLKQFANKSFSQEELTRSEKAIETIQRWIQDLWKKMPLLSTSWKMAETFEAKRAMDLLGDAKNDLKAKITRLEEIVQKPDPFATEDDIQYLIGGYVQSAYGKDNYLKGYLEYAKAFGRNDLIEAYSAQLPDAAQDIYLANWFVKEFRHRQQNEDYFSRLRDAVYLLPNNLKMNVLDINYFRAIYESAFTYELAEIARLEAAHWEQAGVGPKDAGYWHAFKFSPDEAIMWANAGFNDPLFAGRWKFNGFTADLAAQWAARNFMPESGGQWLKLGYDLTEAEKMISEGKTDPYKLPPKSQP